MLRGKTVRWGGLGGRGRTEQGNLKTVNVEGELYVEGKLYVEMGQSEWNDVKMHPNHSVPSIPPSILVHASVPPSHPMPLLSNLVHFGCARPALPWAVQGPGGQEANKFPLRGFGRSGQF